jgi:hypothetical protein
VPIISAASLKLHALLADCTADFLTTAALAHKHSPYVFFSSVQNFRHIYQLFLLLALL